MKDIDYVDDYLRWLVVERGRSATTVASYRRDLADVTTWLHDRKRSLASTRPKDVEAYLVDLASKGAAPATVRRRLAALRGVLRYLKDEAVVDNDATQGVIGARRPASLPKPLPVATMNRLIDSVNGSTAIDRRDRALLEFLYGTGARVSEVTNVELQNLDFREELVLLTGKGSKQRLVPLGQSVIDALRSYLEPSGRGELANEKSGSALFLNHRGSRLSRQGVDLIIRSRAAAAAIPAAHLSAHVFRHSCATHMLDNGADVRVVQELLGHSSIATTQIYTAVSLTSLRSAYADAHPRAHD